MSNFLERLFKYQATPERTPLEDFLTEVLAEWLRLTTADGGLGQVLEVLFMQPWAGQLENETLRSIQWTTQHTIAPGYLGAGKRPDLVGRGNDCFLIIENKIGAPFRYYEDENGCNHQLSLYRKYLESRPEANRGIVLITQFTMPPCNWNDPVLRWGQVYSWLRQQSTAEGSSLNYLSRLFMTFLEVNNMPDTKLSLAAIAAMPAYDELQRGCGDLGQIARQQIAIFDWPEGLGRPHGGGGGSFVWPNFFGEVRSRDGVRVDDSDVILWAGVIAKPVYEIAPSITGIPEISVGIAFWGEEQALAAGAREELQQARTELELMAPAMKWRSEIVPQERAGFVVGFVRAHYSFVDLYRDAGDGFWDELVRDFISRALTALAGQPALIDRFMHCFA